MKTEQNVWEHSWSTLYSNKVAIKKNIYRLRVGKFFKLVPKKTLILDLFCGTLVTGTGLKSKGYEKLICSDISLNMLSKNKGKIIKSICNSMFLPYKNNAFDAVIIQGGLHHLKDLNERVICLNEIKRVLKSCGLVFITEPANTIFLNIWLFFINNTNLWRFFSYTKKWHDLYLEEKDTHADYLKNIPDLIYYIKNNWDFEFHRVGLVTEFFTLRKRSR
jgi:ubiquinone/menaquinone biosynthesis C-methylase UbiE